jgi:hypothetical protein
MDVEKEADIICGCSNHHIGQGPNCPKVRVLKSIKTILFIRFPQEDIIEITEHQMARQCRRK